MSLADFADFCDCMAKTGNSAECMKNLGVTLDGLYTFLKKNPEEKERITIARSVFHDKLVSDLQCLAFEVPERTVEKAGEKGGMVGNKSTLLVALLRENSNRLARAEKLDACRARSMEKSDDVSSIRREIEMDPDPDSIDVGKK